MSSELLVAKDDATIGWSVGYRRLTGVSLLYPIDHPMAETA